MSEKQLATALRLSFQERQFIQTRLYTELLSWQSANGFDLLKTDLGEANA
jgi:hypothetical protein